MKKSDERLDSSRGLTREYNSYTSVSQRSLLLATVISRTVVACIPWSLAWSCGPSSQSLASQSRPKEDTDCPSDSLALSFGTVDTLDIVTWNVEEFPKNGQSTVVAVAEILESMDVDLFALQEISGVPDFEQMVGQLPGWTSYVDSKWYGGLAYLYRTDAIEVVANYEIYTTEEFWTLSPVHRR